LSFSLFLKEYRDISLKLTKIGLPYPFQFYSKEHIILHSSLTVDGSSDGTQQVGVEATLWSCIGEPLG
jgi:hypothetical protein